MGKTLLIVDDSALSRRFVRKCLEIAGCTGYTMLEAGHGEEALALIAGGAQVALVFTDLNMPVMDGEGLLKALKSNPVTTNIPVIVITSIQNEVRENELRKAGAFAVLGKPLTPPQLAGALAPLMGEK